MKPWDIYTWEFPGAETRPAIVLGTETRLGNKPKPKPKVNVLFCSSKPATRRAEVAEIILDKADGLDWETICKCDLIFAVPKEQLVRKRGSVTIERRRQVAEGIIRSLGLAGL